jgi:glutamate synthase domain-containing protein 1
MKSKTLILLLSILFLLSGCTHAVHQYHVSETEKISRRSKVKNVSTISEQFVVMGLVTQTDYVNKAYANLQKKCQTGSITGIHTRFSTSHGFFSWTNKVKMTGVCVR